MSATIGRDGLPHWASEKDHERRIGGICSNSAGLREPTCEPISIRVATAQKHPPSQGSTFPLSRLLDDLVGASQRDRDAKRLGGFQIDDQPTRVAFQTGR